MCAMCEMCPSPDREFASSWRRGGFLASDEIAQGGFLPSASKKPCFPRGRVGHRGWNISSTIWGLAIGGRPAASFAKRLMLPVSNNTLLRVVRRRANAPTEELTVAGIDDWAFRRNHRYGMIVCDLERRQIVTLLPDREIATVQAWLAAHLGIKVISRDRGGGYGEAVAEDLR
jgi:hypothetical protein